jgi:hypothetical protein
MKGLYQFSQDRCYINVNISLLHKDFKMSENTAMLSVPGSEIINNMPDSAIDQEVNSMPPEVIFSIEAAAIHYAIGFRRETQLAGLLAFCTSTGMPSQGSLADMLSVLRAYGYKIRG